jgi:NAD-dependent deacetylase
MEEETPHCDSCGGVIKPDIVFFGEPVKYLDKCIELARESDLFFVVGSSLVVTPAALIPAECKGTIVIVNKGDFSTTYLPMDRVDLVADEDIDAFFKSIDEHLKHD